MKVTTTGSRCRVGRADRAAGRRGLDPALRAVEASAVARGAADRHLRAPEVTRPGTCGLVTPVEDATALVVAAPDAVVKPTNLQTKVDRLAAAGRISTESAASRHP